MNDCIFCKIVAGELPATKVYEDTHTLAFLDIAPLQKGHTLIVPKRHGAKLVDLDEEDAAALMKTARLLIAPLARATSAPDATLAIHDGAAAGQEVPHLHMHVVPRRPDDGGGPLHALFAAPSPASPETLGALAEEIRSHVGQTVR